VVRGFQALNVAVLDAMMSEKNATACSVLA